MKVILTQDVPKLGDAGTIQTVANGYARNYLIPQGLAAIATPGIIKQVEERARAQAKRTAKLEEEMRGLADRVTELRLEIHARVGEQGRLYGSITSADIAERLSAVLGEEIDRRKIEMDAPIREVGEYSIPVRLVGKLVPRVAVVVSDPDAPAILTPFIDPEEEAALAAEAEEALALEVAEAEEAAVLEAESAPDDDEDDQDS
jgi:large subunit ribosomal protein L9